MSQPLIRADLIHLSYNMWAHEDDPQPITRSEHIIAKPYLRFDEPLWDDLLRRMSQAGLNMVVLDVGDGIAFESHPEISVKNAWSRDKLQKEIAKARQLGIELIPKLNFSTCHDVWLKEYERMVSTPMYYQVVGDLIRETLEAFQNPRLFHLGMDEETAQHQRYRQYAVLRQHDLWWHDLFYMVDIVEKHHSRAWVWSDYIWHHPEAFLKQMPRSVLQSNWYYGKQFADFAPDSPATKYVHAYDLLQEHGYDQVPTGSNWSDNSNMQGTVDYCDKVIAPQHLKGYMTAPWHITLEPFRDHHIAAINQLAQALP